MSSKNILRKHMTAIHCEEETISCEECGKFMSSKNILQRHITNIHIHCEGEEATIDDGTAKGILQDCDTIEEETATDATYGCTHGEKAMLETVDDAKVEYEILGHVIKHQATKEPIKVSETADEVLGDNVNNEVDDEKH